MQVKRSEIVMAIIIGAFIIAVIAFGVYPSLRSAPKYQCIENLTSVSKATGLYVADWRGVFPPGDRWADALWPDYADSLRPYVCPESKPTDEQLTQIRAGGEQGVPIGYSFFRPVAGGDATRVAEPQNTPILFDSSEFGANSIADLGALSYRHVGKVANVFMGDGHAESVTSAPTLPKPLFVTAEQMDERTASESDGSP